jgi:hypothetical protein
MSQETRRRHREKILRRLEKITKPVESSESLNRGDKIAAHIWWSFKYNIQVYKHREGPVPNISHWKRRRFWRRPTYCGLRRAEEIKLDPLQEWVEPPVRPREKVDPWDDIPRCISRSWKDHRKTQWKA